MKNNYMFSIFLFLITIIPFVTVDATNDVKYQLTITDDYKFNEVIRYEISDYRDIQNGYNPFVDIIEDDVDVDILGKAKYKKSTRFVDGKYYVTLSYTHSEYSMSNSIFLNDCFEDSDYDYDMDHYFFSGSGGFYCLRGDSLTITIVTNHEVENTNATVNGNRYIWKPIDNHFTMDISINKEYERNNSSDNYGHGINEDINSDTDENDDSTIPEGVDNYGEDPYKEVSSVEENSFSPLTIIIVVGIVLIIGVVVFLILKKKKAGLNKI